MYGQRGAAKTVVEVAGEGGAGRGGPGAAGGGRRLAVFARQSASAGRHAGGARPARCGQCGARCPRCAGDQRHQPARRGVCHRFRARPGALLPDGPAAPGGGRRVVGAVRPARAAHRPGPPPAPAARPCRPGAGRAAGRRAATAGPLYRRRQCRPEGVDSATVRVCADGRRTACVARGRFAAGDLGHVFRPAGQPAAARTGARLAARAHRRSPARVPGAGIHRMGCAARCASRYRRAGADTGQRAGMVGPAARAWPGCGAPRRPGLALDRALGRTFGQTISRAVCRTVRS